MFDPSQDTFALVWASWVTSSFFLILSLFCFRKLIEVKIYLK
jgi:hypothetical protein